MFKPDPNNPFKRYVPILPDDGNGQIAKFMPGGEFNTTHGPWERKGSCYQVFKFKKGEFVGKYEGDGNNAQLISRLAKDDKTYIPEHWDETSKSWFGLVIPKTAPLPIPPSDDSVVTEEDIDDEVEELEQRRVKL